MGSSGTAIIAGVTAADYLGNLGLTKDEKISLAVRLEGPPDNVNSSIAGGLTASLVLDNGSTLYRKCRFPNDISLVFVIPKFHVTTPQGRKVLPKNYPLKDVIYTSQRTSLIFEAVRSRDYTLLSEIIKDKLHQPYRASLVPGLEDILALPYGDGLIGTVLSGSGPTVCTLANDNFEPIGDKILNIFSRNNISSRVLIIKADNTGTKVSVE